MENVTVGDISIGRGEPLCVISGPDVIEDMGTLEHIAETLCDITTRVGVSLIFKASYEKDNRSSGTSYIGPRRDKGLEMLAKIREKYGCPVTADTHRMEDVGPAAAVLDLMQIPAFLCQQTSLVVKFGEAGKPVNVKKGQFLSPQSMAGAVGKLRSTGNRQILLTERGTCFGYNRLVSDLTSIPIMQGLGVPVVYDSTHIIRHGGYPSEDMVNGGSPQFVFHLVRAGIGAGANALFLETHPKPEIARCDAASMLPLDQMEPLLVQAKALHDRMQEWELA